jgi:hypothetical protein
MSTQIHIQDPQTNNPTFTVPLSEQKKPCPFLTPSSRTVHIHEIHLRARLDYGSVQWRNVSDEHKNGVFDVLMQ